MEYGFILVVIVPFIRSEEVDPLQSLNVSLYDSKYYGLDPKKLGEAWHHWMVRGFLKARGEELVRDLPRVERVVFRQCAEQAKTLVQMARCVVRVIDEAERKRKEKERMEQQRIETSTTAVFWMLSDVIRPVKRKPSEGWKRITIPYKGWREEKKLTRELTRNPEWKAKEGRWGEPSREDEWHLVQNDFGSRKRLNIRRMRKAKRSSGRRKRSIEEEKDDPIEDVIRHFTRRSTKKERNHRRKKREIRSTPNLSFSSLAKKYLTKFLGKTDNKGSEYAKKLERLSEHFTKVRKCNQYMKVMNDENKRFFKAMNLPLQLEDTRVAGSGEEKMLEGILGLVNQFVGEKGESSSKWSIMSPRLFSLFPQGNDSNRHLLSPNLFSFHRDGLFSLPDIFNMVSSDESSQGQMVGLIMEMSGAGSALDEALTQLAPQMAHTQDIQYPLIQQMARRDRQWMRATKTFEEKQREELGRRGYTLLSPKQISHVYPQGISWMDIEEYSRMSDEERMARIDGDIRRLANIGRRRKRRQVEEGTPPHIPEEGHPSNPNVPGSHVGDNGEIVDESGHENERINGVLFETLEPYAFTNFVGQGAALEVVTLSPHAFIGEILRPEALLQSTLSPRAFIATVLSPAALVARVLSPTALRGEVLSPRALYAWVLSPEAMVAEVLTPRAMDSRVLSPETLIIDVLSPGFLSPHVLSSESIGLIILSPNILSPRIASEERYLVEILSPHILGGPHTAEESGRVGSDEEGHDGEHRDGHHGENHETDHGNGHGEGHEMFPGLEDHSNHGHHEDHGLIHLVGFDPPIQLPQLPFNG